MGLSPEGWLCTAPDAVERFLAGSFDGAGTLRVRRESGLWDAVEAAHAAGKRGAGQRVAVLDSGFDRGYGRVAAIAGPGSDFSTDSLAGRHGTAVALLINDIAPEAGLTFHDVWPGAYLHRDVVGSRLAAVLAAGDTDLVNMSLGFETDAAARVVDLGGVDVELDAHPATVRLVLSAVALPSLHFVDGGCTSPCALCAATTGHATPVPAVVAAAGNGCAPQCPAVHERVVGAGFEQEVRSAGRIGFSRPTFVQADRTELALAQPPGFDATSFAAPLLTGVAALDGAGPDLAALIGVANAMSVVQRRHQVFGDGVEPAGVTERRALEILDEYRFVLDMLPPPHRHADRADPPCATCGVLLVDLYLNAGLLALELGLDEESDRWLRAGLRVCPLCPDLLLNRGAFFRQQAELAEAAGASSVDQRRRSAACYLTAAQRRPSDPEFVAGCQAWAAAVAPAV